MVSINKVFVLIAVIVAMIAALLLLGKVVGPLLLDLNLHYPGLDKVVHVAASLLIALLFFFMLTRLRLVAAKGVAITISLLAAISIGVIEEILQLYSAQRSVEAGDLLSNFAGVFIGYVVLTANRRKMVFNVASIVIAVGSAALIVRDTYHENIDYYSGLLSMRSGDYTAAYQYFDTAIKNGGEQPGLYNEAAWVMLEFLAIEPALALQYTTIAYRHRPDSADILDTHGWALYKNGYVEEAAGFLLRSYRKKPSGYCIQYHLGEVLYALGRYEEAKVHLINQLALNSSDRYAEASRKLLEKIDV